MIRQVTDPAIRNRLYQDMLRDYYRNLQLSSVGGAGYSGGYRVPAGGGGGGGSAISPARRFWMNLVRWNI